MSNLRSPENIEFYKEEMVKPNERSTGEMQLILTFVFGFLGMMMKVLPDHLTHLLE